MSTARTIGATATFSAELQEFLLELGLALQRHAMYPGGHPSVDEAVGTLSATTDRLLRDRDVVSLGVARRQIVVEGIATDASHRVLRALAERLHRHRLGAVVFRRGTTRDELRDVLRALADDPERSGEPLGALPPERLTAWDHIRLYRVTYEQLQLTGDGDGDGMGTSGAELWIGLARAALERGDEMPLDDADPDDVARAINDHPAAQAYDQMVVGYMLQLADELRRDPGAAAGVRSRVSRLISSLDAETLDRLLRMGGDRAQRQKFLRQATDSLEPDAVLEVVRAAARTEGEDISTSMLRLLRKLSTLATHQEGATAEAANDRMRDQVKSLLEGWSLEDPNPDQYTQALDALSARSSDQTAVASQHAPEPLRMVQMSLEVGVTGPALWRAVDALIDETGLAGLFELMDAAEDGNAVVAAVWQKLETADHIRRILTTDPVDFDALDRIFARLPPATVLSLLLDRLSESTSRGTRMGVFRRVSARGYAAVPAIMERLHDGRWFVIRNMLALLNEIGSWPANFSALDYIDHGQMTVRREAVQLAVRIPAQREAGIVAALNDRDERTLRTGLNAARDHGLPGRAVGTLLQRLSDEALPGDVRALMIRLLAPHAVPVVIERLLGFVVQERRLLGTRLMPTTPELLAAVSAFAGMRTKDPRVAAALKLARASDDAEVRDALTLS